MYKYSDVNVVREEGEGKKWSGKKKQKNNKTLLNKESEH